jgi:hypothetical protein
MQQQNTVSPDAVCQQAIQAKLNVYRSKEQFETVIKYYNDHVDNLIHLIEMMKNRIIELEGELGKSRLTDKQPPAFDTMAKVK